MRKKIPGQIERNYFFINIISILIDKNQISLLTHDIFV